jgi:hypothetical protein
VCSWRLIFITEIAAFGAHTYFKPFSKNVSEADKTRFQKVLFLAQNFNFHKVDILHSPARTGKSRLTMTFL